jgi:hypothetical protein
MDTFLFIIGQTYKVLKRDTMLKLHSFEDRGSNRVLLQNKMKGKCVNFYQSSLIFGQWINDLCYIYIWEKKKKTTTTIFGAH